MDLLVPAVLKTTDLEMGFLTLMVQGVRHYAAAAPWRSMAHLFGAAAIHLNIRRAVVVAQVGLRCVLQKIVCLISDYSHLADSLGS
jgi:hypothetical protein